MRVTTPEPASQNAGTTFSESSTPGIHPEQISNLKPAPTVTAPAPERISQPEVSAGVLFRALVYGGTGYGEEAWVEALGLAESGIPVQLVPMGARKDSKRLLPVESRQKLEQLKHTRLDISRSVYYQGSPADGWDLETYGRCRVARTMFETDRIPDGWKELCNRMDEIWVPGPFNFETFAASGVHETKLKIMPAGVDTRLFRPGLKPLTIPKKRKFSFLSVFDWHDRKGYDVLFKAYAAEFKVDEDVCLILKVYQINDPRADLESKIVYFLEREVGLPLEKTPPIILLNGFIPQADMPRLYASADAFVLPSRGEGYGRPYMEALACQMPVIGTRWSGQADFLNDLNSYPIEIEGVFPVSSRVDLEHFAGHRWAEPSLEHLRRQMRRVFSNPEEVHARAARGRADMISQFDWRVIIPRWVTEFRRLLEG
ncbi:MAG TPA: glycosyltransferase [Terriglobia bacterium]|nr:glycosyltransferase [Terriglobia bacterium]